MMLFVSLMTGCFGSDDSSTPTPAATSSVVITGTIPALSAPAGAPNYMVNYGTNYEMGVYNAATMAEIAGSAVVINGTSYTATVPASAVNVTAVIVIRHKTTGKVVYSALAGILPTTTQMSAASLTKVNVSGVNLDGESTALATIAKDKGVIAPSIPVSTSVTTMSATVKSELSTAVGAPTVTAIKDAVTAIQAVLNASTGVSEATKNSILSTLNNALANVLNAFVTAVKDNSAIVNQTIGATTVTVGGTTISSTTTPAEVTGAVNNVVVVTVTAVTNPSDIAVANGTALSAITFPTTVTVTMSNATTATRNVVWSTVSTPVYNANVEGAYSFTGTVDGTTLKATVKVNVGIIQLKAATPTFSPAAGTFTAAQSVTIATTTTGATIHYTVDGSEPTVSSPTYTSAIAVSATTTIKAMAAKTGMTSSDVATATYTINISLVPVISAERAVKQANGDVVVTWTTNIVTPTAAKVIIRGAIPTPSDPSVTETVSTTTSHTVTVPAATFPTSFDKLVISYIIGEDGTSKEILKAAIIEAASVVADPVITPAAGTYTSAQSVTITSATAGASIYYTIDGSTPNSLSTLYSGAIAVSSSLTVKAIAIKATMTDSNVVSAAYVVNIPPVTKVLTGIALAKATDTVEAETSYALPTAKASYDDNSIPADVTVTWVEVLAGGNVAVTSPVTKNVAGTYNFQASYTENSVTKTADFVLVVTAKVPVKTLQSITVTANPTAPTCVMGSTATVALTVVANYMTGTVASTEEVTTFTTSSNWAAGVFTPTAVGTENIVVTFETKTANVAVTVTAAPTGIDTVEVSALSVVEYGTTSPVVVVKDAAGVVIPATEYTLSYAVNNTVVSVNATTGVITGGAYNASANTSTLSVTATPVVAGGTAKTGTATVTVTQDTTAPTIVSVTAKSSSIVEVLFSKALKTTTGATTVANYAIAKLTGGTSTVGAAALSADGKTVTLTITATLLVPSPNGYVLQIPNAQANKVEDLAGNDVVAGSEMIFTGVGTSDTTPPSLISTAFDGANKTVTFKFDKLIDVTPSTQVALTSISFTGTTNTTSVTLTSSETLSTTVDATDVVVNLSTSINNSILALGDGLKVNILAGAFKDTASTPNSILAVTGATVSATPALSSVTYSQANKTLTYVFNKTMKISSLTDITLFGYKVNGTAYALTTSGSTTEKDTLVTTSDSTTVVFNLGTTSQGRIEVSGATFLATVTAGAIQDSNAVANGTISDATLTYTADTTTPTVVSANYNDSTQKLYINFSKNMATSGFDATKVSISWTNDDTTTGTTVGASATVSGKVMTVTLANANVEAATVNRSTIYLVLATSHGIKDTANVAVANIAATDLKAVTYTDQVLPKLSYSTAANGTNQLSSLVTATAVTATRTQLKLIFSEKVDATTLVPANINIALNSNSTVTFAVSAITLLSDGYTAYCTTADQTTYAGQLLKVTVTNVKDQAGNLINTAFPTTGNGATASLYENTTTALNVGYIVASNTATTGSTPQLKSSGIVFTDVNNNSTLDAGDKITVTFNLPIAKKDGLTAFTLTNVFELSVSSTPSFGTNATMAILGTDKVAITLGTTPAITLDSTKIDVKASQTELVSVEQVAAVASTPQVIPYPAGSASGPVLATAPAIYYEDTNASGKKDAGDKVTFTFDQNLYATSGATTADVVKSLTLFGSLTDTTGYAYSISGKAITVTMGTVIPTFTVNNAGSMYDVGGTIKLQNSWGKVAVASTTQRVMSADTTAPYLVSAVWYDENANNVKDTGDYMLYTFSEPVTQPSITLYTGGSPNVFATFDGAADAMFYYASGATVTGVTGAWTTNKVLKGMISAGTFTADATKMNANAGYTAAGALTNKLADASDNLLAQGADVTITKVTGTNTGGQSTAPTAATDFSASAATNKITVAATITGPAATSGTIKVYVNNLYRQSISLTGALQSVTVTGDVLKAGDTLSYTYTDTATNKSESTFLADGSIPAAPLKIADSTLSNNSGLLTMKTGEALGTLAAATVRIYTDTDTTKDSTNTVAQAQTAAGQNTTTTGATFTFNKTTADAAYVWVANTFAGKYPAYSIVEPTNGNESDVTFHTTAVPALTAQVYTVAAAAAANSVVYSSTAGAEKLSFYVTGSETAPATISAVGDTDLKALMNGGNKLLAGDKITIASNAISKVELVRTSANAATVAFGALPYAVDVTAQSGQKITLTGTALTTVNILGGPVDIEGATATAFNVNAVANATVTAGGKTLAAVNGAYTISITTSGAAVTAATVNGAVTTLTIDGALTTLNVGAAVGTLTINAAVATVNVGTATQVAAFTVGTLDVANAGSVTTAINVRGHATLAAAANTPTVTLLKTTGAGALAAVNIGSTAGTYPGIVGTLAPLSVATNVTVGVTGDIATAVTLPNVYAGTWTSSTKNLTAATFTVTTTGKLVGTINLNASDNVITTTTVTHQKEGNYADASVTTLLTAANGATSAAIAANVVTLGAISTTADTFSYGIQADLASTPAGQRFRITVDSDAVNPIIIQP
jgi:hypothetical protein